MQPNRYYQALRVAMGLAVVATAACVSTRPPDVASPTTDVVAPRPRPLPTELGSGPRSVRSGSVSREAVVRVLNEGPALFLRAHDVSPVADGATLIGWRLMRFFPTRAASPLGDVDVLPGDVLLSVNGTFVERPEHLMAVWQSLYTAAEIRAVLARNLERIELHYQIIDAPVALPPVPPIAATEAPTPTPTMSSSPVAAQPPAKSTP